MKMMKAIVAHYQWSYLGGRELVSGSVVKALLEKGYEVAIASAFGFKREIYEKWFQITLRNARVYRLLPEIFSRLGIYSWLGFHTLLRKVIMKERPDIVFIDDELYGPISKMRKKIGFKIIEYIHFPYHMLHYALGLKKTDISSEHRDVFKKYLSDTRMRFIKYKKGFRRYYFMLWLKLFEKIARDNPFETADAVVTNSKYIAKLIRLLWGEYPLILHPPVTIKEFESYGQKSFEERDDAVVMIGRISPEKRILDAINALALTNIKPILRVIGQLSPEGKSYKKLLEKKAKKTGIQIEFYPNVPRKILAKIVSASKIFVHTAIGEHFGIAVVEGMAGGCPVIVHRSGGPFEDIIDYGKYGLSYNSLGELAEYIDRLLTNKGTWNYYHKRSLKRALAFSEKAFTQRFFNLIKIIF